jgi:hypothetical protein
VRLMHVYFVSPCDAIGYILEPYFGTFYGTNDEETEIVKGDFELILAEINVYEGYN